MTAFYSQKSVFELENARGRDAHPSNKNSKAKSPHKPQRYPKDDLTPESGICAVTKSTLWQMDDAAGSIGKMLKKWKEMVPTVFWAIF